MKKLSIEQKAQAYDEALERAKRMFSEKELYYLFPELEESEDEKIRKELIEQVVYIVPNNDEVDSEGNVLPTHQKRIDKYRAWLEKQGSKELVTCPICNTEEWLESVIDEDGVFKTREEAMAYVEQLKKRYLNYE